MGWAATHPNAGWQSFVRANTRPTSPSDDAFSGGVVGWLGYEAGATVEVSPARRVRATHEGCLWRVEGAVPSPPNRSRHSGRDEAFKAQALSLLDDASVGSSLNPNQSESIAWEPPDVPGKASTFTAGVSEVLDHVRRGDVYQVSLSWEQTRIPVENATKAWLQLRTTNPATRGCLVRRGPVELVSNSPELFLEIDPRSRRLRSSPIKGTAALSSGPEGLAELRQSPKERAELTMIVDLVRNDLGRVAVPGTVKTGEREVRVCGDLWHAEQTVEADLAQHQMPSMQSRRLCLALLPAPPRCAMEVIIASKDSLGVYTGAIGFFADGGGAHFNVAIRQRP